MVFRVTDAYISLNDWYISLSAFGWVGGGREGILTNKHQMHIDPDEQPDGVAPEMIQRRDYTKSADVWALSVIIFVLLCECLPFDDDCQQIPNSPDLRTRFTLRFPLWV